MHVLFRKRFSLLTLFPFLKKVLCYAIVFSMMGNDMAFAMMRGRATSELKESETSRHPPLQRRLSASNLALPHPSALADELLPPSRDVVSGQPASPAPVPIPAAPTDGDVGPSPHSSFVAGSVGAMALERLPQQPRPGFPLLTLAPEPILPPSLLLGLADQIQAIVEGREIDGEAAHSSPHPALNPLMSVDRDTPVPQRPLGAPVPVDLSPQDPNPTETTPLLGTRRGGFPLSSHHGSIQEGDLPDDLESNNELQGFVEVDFPEDGDEESAFLLNGRHGTDLVEGEETLRIIEGRPFFLRWIYLDHLFEKTLYALSLRKGSQKGCCKSSPLWVEGQGIPLRSGFTVARGITAFRVGLEYGIFQPLTLILNALMGYQLYTQLSGHKDFNPLKIVGVWWNGDEQSIQGALSVIVQKPQYAPYFLVLFVMPFIWGLGNVARVRWNTRNETPASFQETTQSVSEFSHPRQGCCSGLWTDKLRWLFPFPAMDGEVSDLVYGLLLDGRLTLPERQAALDTLIHFTRNATGYAKLSGLNGIQRVAVGTSLNQLPLVERTFGTAYKNAVLTEKIRALEELRRQNPGLWKAGIGGLVHNLYANYLRWAMGDFNGKANAASWTVYKMAKLGLQAYLYVEIAQQIIAYLRCPKPLQKGFSYAMSPASYESSYSSPCLQAYLNAFNQVPGQPASTLLDKLHLFRGLDASFFRNLTFAGRGLTGTQIGPLLRGLQNIGLTITALDLSNNAIGQTTADMEKLLPLPSTLTELDLSQNGIGADDNAVVLLGQALPSLPQLQVFKLEGTQVSSGIGCKGDAGTCAIGQGLASLTVLQSLDLSNNCIGLTADDGTAAIGESLCFLTKLRELDLSINPIGRHGANGTIAIGNSLPCLPDLQSLQLGLNDIASRESVQAIGQGARSLSNLQSLGLSYLGSGSLGIGNVMGTTLPALTALTALDLSGNVIGQNGDQEVLSLATGLAALKKLRVLNLSKNNIGLHKGNGTVVLGNSISFLTDLVDLELSLNFIGQYGNAGAQAINQALSSLSSLQTLYLSGNFIGVTCGSHSECPVIAFLIGNVTQLPSLFTLYIQQRIDAAGAPYAFTPAEMTALATYWHQRSTETDIYRLISLAQVGWYFERLPQNTTSVLLSGLFVPKNASVVTDFMERLASLPFLYALDLSNNVFDDASLKALGLGLQPLTGLQSLNLSTNLIGDGVDAISKAFPYLANLTALDLSNNGIGVNKNSTLSLIEGLTPLTKLKTLNLWGNGIGYYNENEGVALGSVLPSFSDLTALDLSGNGFAAQGEDGTVAIAQALTSLPHLTYLDLALNGIGTKNDAGTGALAAVLPSLKRLQFFDISENPLGSNTSLALYNFSDALGALLCQHTICQTDNTPGLASLPWDQTSATQGAIYSAQIQRACAANHCFGTSVHTPKVTCASSPASSLTSPAARRLFTSMPWEEPDNDVVLYRAPQSSAFWYSSKEKDGIWLRTSMNSAKLFLTSALEGGASFFLLEMVRDGLASQGASKRRAHLAVSLSRIGILIYTGGSMLSLGTVAINEGLASLGASPTVSAIVGNAATIAVTLASNDEATPVQLAVSIGGSIIGVSLALKAKNRIYSWLKESETVSHMTGYLKSSWTNFFDMLVILDKG